MTNHDQHERIKAAIHQYARQLFELARTLDEIAMETPEPPAEVMDWSRKTTEILYMYRAPLPEE